MGISTYCMHQLLFLACLVCCLTSGLFTTYGTITPQSPQVEIGKNFTATCVLYETAESTADDIFWTCNGKVPEELYTKINDSAVSVTIKITPDTCKWLICNKQPRYVNQTPAIHGIMLTKGYPPEKPNNLSCMAVQSGQKISPILNCSWEPGTRDELLKTNYTLHTSDCFKTLSNSSQKSIGYINMETFPSYCELKIWVEVANSLGKVQSETLTVGDANYLVKTNPPLNVHIYSENNFPRSLLVKWRRPIEKHFFRLKYNIRFCAVGSEDWSEVPPNDTESDVDSFRLQHLKPYTEYVVQVRCMHSIGLGYWSDWSANATWWTPEDKPSSQPDLWRVVIPSQGKSERRVQVMCKDPVESNGRIRNYSIKIQDGGRKTVLVNRSETESRKIIPLYQFVLPDDGEALIELDACNSRGMSPRASLTIPKFTHEPPSVKSLSWFTKEGRLWVEWVPHRGKARDVTEYILEWVSVSDGALDWQRERKNGTNKSLAYIRGNLEKFKRYSISVYPMYSGKTGKPWTEPAFLDQKAPMVGPVVNVSRCGKNDAELRWMEIPLDKQQGFITNYTIFYTMGKQEQSITVSADTYSYTLKHLTSGSKYVVRVMASTVAGDTFGPEYTFNTLEYAPGEIEGIVVLVCLAFLFLVVSLVVTCILKMERIKKKIWPPVPDPSNSTIANWSPDFPSKADPVSKENALGDVSVVEVDVFDGRSLCEEDKAGLPLKKDKYLSEEHSSGIGGSSCMSSPRQSVSDSDEGGDSGQTTASTVQYSSVVASSGYKGQTPQPCSSQAQTPSFARSESTQPLLESEEQPEGQEGSGQPHLRHPRNAYFRRLPGGSSDDDDNNSGDPGDLNQLEMEDQGLTLLQFSPLEEGSQQTTPTEEGQTPDGQLDPIPSYLPQLRGYRPQ
ncbi:interleukin-6 receptor subunit beta isoform X2 [Esox lucius]|uniref:interleukin-6 receptor subunit beta isoform X2 n=1 Tax=Esox lucius TaxID=8010 RepID=UPI00147717FA|nr:interleukin-6 receptor subunit beta isoform X2 [Esox lucius]